MGKFKINGCPRCGGTLFIDRDMDGWYEQCLNCSYRSELKVSVSSSPKVTTKNNPPST